jgi:cytoskeletal protein CcmA (bactofilin family)
MWKQRTDSTESTDHLTESPETPASVADISEQPAPAAPTPVSRGSKSATLGPSVVIKGELSGEEDLRIEGRVDGTIELRQHSVVIGQQATVNAQIFAQDVVVLGKVFGDITASIKIEIGAQGSVEGDLVAPAVAIAEGATFRGSIDMSRESAESAA